MQASSDRSETCLLRLLRRKPAQAAQTQACSDCQTQAAQTVRRKPAQAAQTQTFSCCSDTSLLRGVERHRAEHVTRRGAAYPRRRR
eukprot:gene12164-biopygen3028